MSLLVHAYVRAADDRLLDVPEEPRPPHNDLGGPERWRWTVYGAPAARALGLRLLPSLVTGDLYVEGDELDALEREVRGMLADLSRWPDIDPEALRFRLGNILEAIRLARTVPAGGVSIA